MMMLSEQKQNPHGAAVAPQGAASGVPGKPRAMFGAKAGGGGPGAEAAIPGTSTAATHTQGAVAGASMSPRAALANRRQLQRDGSRRRMDRKRSSRITTRNFNSASKSVFDLLMADGQHRGDGAAAHRKWTSLPVVSTETRKVGWDAVVWCALAWLSVTIPLAVGFEVDSVALAVVDALAELVLLLDVVVSLCVVPAYAMKPHRTWRSLWPKAARKYAKSWMVLDFVAAIPMVGWLPTSSAVRLVRFLRALHLPRSPPPKSVTKLGRQHTFAAHAAAWAVGALLVVHNGACVWHAVDAAYGGSWQLSVSTSALAAGADLGYTYVAYAYASFGALCLVGHGGVVPDTAGARLVSLFLSFGGLGGMVALLSSMGIGSGGAGAQVGDTAGWRKVVAQNAAIASWMRHWDVPTPLQVAVQAQLAAQGHAATATPRTLLQALPAKARRELVQHISGKLATSAPLLAAGSLGFRQAVIPLLVPSSPAAGDYVQLYGCVLCARMCDSACWHGSDQRVCLRPPPSLHSESATAMYFVLRGKIELGDAYGDLKATVGQSQFFGEQECMLGSFITVSARAAKASQLLALNREDLLNMCAFHPDFEQVRPSFTQSLSRLHCPEWLAAARPTGTGLTWVLPDPRARHQELAEVGKLRDAAHTEAGTLPPPMGKFDWEGVRSETGQHFVRFRSEVLNRCVRELAVRVGGVSALTARLVTHTPGIASWKQPTTTPSPWI